MSFPSTCMLFLLLVLFVNCKQNNSSDDQHASLAHTSATQPVLINGSGNQIPTGVPLKIQGTRFYRNSESEPSFVNIVRQTEPASLKKNISMMEKPIMTQASGTVRPIPTDEYDRTIPATGFKKPALYPKPIQALSSQMNNNATRDIRYWGTHQNLNTAAIWTMIQDRRGDVWIGSLGGGAIRFNGKQFEHFTEKEGLAGNHVFSILEDRKGNIWFGTRNQGISRFDGTHFTHFDTEHGLPHNFVLCMLEDSKGNVWIGTRGGLSRFDGIGFTNYTEKEGLAYKEVISLFEDSQHRLWIGTGEGTGVQRFDGDHFTHYNVGEGKGKNDVHAMIEDHQGNIWFGTWGGGMIMFDGSQFHQYSTEQGLRNDYVLSILEDETGSIWLGSLGGGVSKLEGNVLTHYTTDEGLSSNNVRYIWEDEQQHIWACTWDKGINRINKQGFQVIRFNRDQGVHEIHCMGKDQQGNLCLGTNIGVSKFDGKRFTHFQSQESIIFAGVISIFVDEQQNYWLGAGGGVSQWNDNGIRDFTREEGLLAGDIRTIHQDRSGHLWFGTFAGGIIRYDSNSFLQYSEKEGFISDDVYAIYEDHEGNLWFGTVGGGVSRFDGTDFIHYTTNEGLSHNNVLSILGDQNGHIWIGTEDGLNKFDGARFIQYSTDDGLLHNTIYSLSFDQDEHLWIKTPKGISRLFSADPEGELPDKEAHFVNLGKEDGFNESNLSNGSCIIDKQNRLWLEAEGGLKMLDLNHFQSPQKPPSHVRLTNLEINQSFIDFGNLLLGSKEQSVDIQYDVTGAFDQVIPFHNLPQHLLLPYQANHLSFHFSAVDWIAPEKIQYQYKMEGIDSGWSLSQSEAKVNYRNLPHGTFTLWVRAKGRANIWSEPISYTFRITPPWWRTWWAYLGYIGLLFFIGYQLYKLQLSKRIAIEEGKRLKEISELKSNIYTNVTHEFRTPLTVINGMVEELERGKREEVLERTHVIKTHSKKLLQIVNQLLQLSKLESQNEDVSFTQGNIISFIRYLVSSHQFMASNKQISLDFESEEEQFVMDFDSRKLETVLTNLISNAIKFTPKGGSIRVEVQELNTLPPPCLEIKVIDNGIGIPEDELAHVFNRFHQVKSDHSQEGTGIGLALVKELVNVMDGQVSVSSQLKEGTIFSIQLPIHNKASLITEPSDDSIAPVLPLPPPDQEQAVVLIIEDSMDIIRYVKGCLEDRYHILVSQNGEDGLAQAFEQLPDLIITDVMMPGMNGFQLCERIKEDDRTNHIPLIMLTARVTMNDRLEGLAKGADAYLVKPFEKKELLIRLEKLLALRKALQKKYLEELTNKYGFHPIEDQPRDPFIEKAEQAILANLSQEDFSVNALADILCLSRSQVNRKIKATTGLSTSLFIRHIRLLEARQLLKSSDLSVSEILYQVGFKSPAYFSQVYKNQFGRNPSDERKS